LIFLKAPTHRLRRQSAMRGRTSPAQIDFALENSPASLRDAVFEPLLTWKARPMAIYTCESFH